MEKIYAKVMIAILAMLAFIPMTSCSDDNDEPDPKSEIYGAWQQENSMGTLITITFQSDMNGDIEYIYPSGKKSMEYFEYSYTVSNTGNRILNIMSEDCQLHGRYYVEVTNTYIELTDTDGSTYRFRKV